MTILLVDIRKGKLPTINGLLSEKKVVTKIEFKSCPNIVFIFDF